MVIADNYRWEAEKADGEIITVGEYLNDCVRFSLIPQVHGLPQHDLVGVHMHRRFNRGFVRAMGSKDPEYLYCVVCDTFRLYVKASDGTVLITPTDYELYL